MHQCTIPDGEKQHTLVKGEKDKEYILAIDPSFSNSPSSDFLCNVGVGIGRRKNHNFHTLVHGYAVAEGI